VSDLTLFPDGDGGRDDGTVEGEVKSVLYEDHAKPWRVLRLRTSTGDLVAVGRFGEVSLGDRLRVVGRYEESERYGPRFVMESYLEVEPNTLEGLVRYLGGGRFAGIGEGSAKRIVDAFGLETLEVLDHAPHRLATVSGLGKKKALTLGNAWRELRESRELELLLTTHGLGGATARRIREKYGARASDQVRHEPYRLARDVAGIGFRTADALARSLGVTSDSAARVMAGVFHALGEGRDDGHTCLPVHELFGRARTLLAVDGTAPADEALEAAVNALVREHAVAPREEAGVVFYALMNLASAELAIAGDVRRLQAQAGRPLSPTARTLERLKTQAKLELGEEQRAALELAREEPFVVITGGPGCGKTTLLRAILMHLASDGLRVSLAAPTGRAARRMAEATGRDARTIHRLLEVDPRRGFTRSRANPLEGDAFVIDEASMLDVPLAEALLSAIPDGARVLFVGDVDQLPSVGPGAFLRDLIDARAVAVARLTKIYRQAEESLIVQNAYRLKNGEAPLAKLEGIEPDFFFIERQGSDAIAETIGTVVNERIPRRFGLDPRRDVQVLVPMHKGAAGTIAMNERLQALLNPAGDSVRRGQKVLRVGDRVLQLVNDAQKQIANGDQGTIVRLDREAQTVIVRFEDGEGSRELKYELAELDQLALAYACTIHKSQGSEFPAVVVAVAREHALMLRRNLLYTAFTRAKRLLVVVGEERALGLALRDDRVEERHTALGRLLAAPPGAVERAARVD
jgi:exodeoxyribonuclease V alpha subunit